MTTVSNTAPATEPALAAVSSPPPASPSDLEKFAHIDAASRVKSLVKTKKLEDTLEEQRSGQKNDAASRWKRAGVMATRLGEQETAPAPAVKGEHKPKPAKTQSSDKPAGDHTPSRMGSLTDQLQGTSFFEKLPFRFKDEAEKQEFIQESEALTKRMEDQNWLEMLDPKHRYGSNLKHYHRYWANKADTTQNFLQWLDEGDGKDISLEECPREKLEEEQIAYLTVDQRKNYMTYIDNEHESSDHGKGIARSTSFTFHQSGDHGGKGRLRWCRTGALVDTSKYDHGDLGKGRGVALRESQEWQTAVISGEACDVVRDDQIKVKKSGTTSSSSSFTSYDGHSDPSHLSGSEDDTSTHQDAEGNKERSDSEEPERRTTTGPKARGDPDEKQQTRKERWLEQANLGPKYLIKKKLGLYSTSGRQQIVQGDPQKGLANETSHPDALIRRRKADTWIFVTDLSYNLYIGIKQRGRFQHSSLLAGSLVTVAGVLKVKNGVIVSIYPWSGHYRSSSQHFEEFIKRLQERGLDTSKINVTKSKWVIEVVNRYGMYRKKKDRKIKDIKDNIHEAWDHHTKSQSDEKQA